MNHASLKYLFTLLLLSLAQTTFSQENKLEITIEYVPNFSRFTYGGDINNFKLSHNATVRISHIAKGKVSPTVGLGFLNTGEIETVDFSNEIFQGQIERENIYTSDYLYIPVGAKISFSKIYLLPEIGIGINFSNRIRQISKYPMANNKRNKQIISPDSEALNALTIPVLLSIGTDVNIGNHSFSTGVKGYYGLNPISKSKLRNDHYFGLGLILAISL